MREYWIYFSQTYGDNGEDRVYSRKPSGTVGDKSIRFIEHSAYTSLMAEAVKFASVLAGIKEYQELFVGESVLLADVSDALKQWQAFLDEKGE